MVFGFLLWALSPILVGVSEPWDAGWPFYSVCSLAAGVALGAWLPRHVFAAYLGAWSGQVLALLTLPSLDRDWWLLGLFTTAIGSLVFLAGYALASLWKRRR